MEKQMKAYNLDVLEVSKSHFKTLKKIGYHTHTMHLYDMFPHTSHVESICLLSAK